MGSTGDRGEGVILRDGRIPESNTYILEYLWLVSTNIPTYSSAEKDSSSKIGVSG